MALEVVGVVEWEWEFDKKDLAFVINKLKKAREKAPQVFRNAVNRTAADAKKKMAEGAQASYTVKKRDFNSHMPIKKASVGHLSATITAKGQMLSVTDYKYTAPTSGAKADIVKTGLKQIHRNGNKAFLMRGKSRMNTPPFLLAVRVGKEHLPVQVLHANSVPKMLEMVYQGERGIWGSLDPIIQKKLHDAIVEEVRKQL